MPELVYLLGAPGSGKTTLMAELTAGEWAEQTEPFAHRTRPGVALLGRARAAFGGTDTLPMNVARTAERWISEFPHRHVLGEGDRLAYARFFEVAASAGYRLWLYELATPAPVSEQRRATRAAEHGAKLQNAAWVKGRASKARLLSDGFGARRLDGTLPPAANAEQIRREVPGLDEALRGIVPDSHTV